MTQEQQKLKDLVYEIITLKNMKIGRLNYIRKEKLKLLELEKELESVERECMKKENELVDFYRELEKQN